MLNKPTITRPMHGFTIIEAIVVIVITGIIAGIVALIIGRTAGSYDSLNRRDKLQTSARLAIERIVREVRHALPNSICTFNGATCAGPADRLYFVRSIDAGRYQNQAGTYPSGDAHNPLIVGAGGANLFDVVSGPVSSDVVNGQWVVVYNTNNTDPYIAGNRNQLNGTTTLDTGNGIIGQVLFPVAVSFPKHSPHQRFHIIEDEATLFYLDGTELKRADTDLDTPNTIAGTPPILLQNVQNLSFTYDGGSQHRAGLLKIELTISEDNEQIQVVHEAHVYNVP